MAPGLNKRKRDEASAAQKRPARGGRGGSNAASGSEAAAALVASQGPHVDGKLPGPCAMLTLPSSFASIDRKCVLPMLLKPRYFR
jgi:hypothetical protein